MGVLEMMDGATKGKPAPVAQATPGRSLYEAMPNALGMAGGTVGGTPGAILGGMAGKTLDILRPGFSSPFTPIPSPEGIQNLISQGPEQAFGQIAKEGARQGAYQLGGTALMKSAGPVARGLMRTAILPAKAIRQSFPDVAKTALEEGVLQGKTVAGKLAGQLMDRVNDVINAPVLQKLGLAGKVVGGSKTVAAMRTASSMAEDRMLNDAAARGIRFTPVHLAEPALEQAEQNVGRPLSFSEQLDIVRQIHALSREALGERAFGAVQKRGIIYTPQDVQFIKQWAGERAGPLLKAKAAGVAPAGNPDLVEALRQGAKRSLETKLGYGKELIPGIADQAAKTQKLIGLHRAMIGRETAGGTPWWVAAGARGGPAVAGAAIGGLAPGDPMERAQHAAMGAAAGAFAGAPLTLSTAALALHSPLMRQILLQVPRGTVGAFNQAFPKEQQ